MTTRFGLMSLVIGLVLSWFVPVAGVAVMLAAAVGMAITSEVDLVAHELLLEPAPSVPVLPVDLTPVDDAA